jgi:microcystin-dependent protein
MSQGSLVIPTTGTLSGLQLVNAINDAVDNLVTNASGSTDPSTLTGGVKPYSFWLDTSVSPNVLRMRNAANTAWAAMGTISGTNFIPNLEYADISTALGFTPVNKAGDTMSGDLEVQNLNATTKSEAPVVKASTKFVFADNTEQATAAKPEFPTGTVMLFVQSVAPTGWTKSTAHNDKALRVVSGSVSSGGSIAFSTAFGSMLSTDFTTLSTNQIPSHNHTLTNFGASFPDGGGYVNYASNAYGSSFNTGSSGGGQGHNHTLPSFAVQYVDVIICTRN